MSALQHNRIFSYRSSRYLVRNDDDWHPHLPPSGTVPVETKGWGAYSPVATPGNSPLPSAVVRREHRPVHLGSSVASAVDALPSSAQRAPTVGSTGSEGVEYDGGRSTVSRNGGRWMPRGELCTPSTTDWRSPDVQSTFPRRPVDAPPTTGRRFSHWSATLLPSVGRRSLPRLTPTTVCRALTPLESWESMTCV